jgi:hypothetical protein
VKIPGVTIGNAAEDGKPFRHWFIGDLARWAALSPAAAQDRFGARQALVVGVKWGVHPAGERRPGGWAEGDDSVTLSAVVSGDFVLSFEDGRGGIVEAPLHHPGDYAIWYPGTRHTWVAVSDCVILTVRWREPLAREGPGV